MLEYIYDRDEYKDYCIDGMEDEIISALENRGLKWQPLLDDITDLATKVVEGDITYANAMERAFALCA